MSMSVSETDRRLANVIRVGRVVSVDPGAARAVVSFGDFETPPIPVGQLSAGAIQFWWMPSAGEQVIVACEGGDPAQGCIIASIYASNAPSSNGAEPQINLAGGQMVVNGTIIVTGDVIAQGVSLVHHVHGGVVPGGGQSGEPVK